MSRKPKTPEELALEKAGKKTYSLYLDISLMENIKNLASEAGLSASDIANEALSVYLSNVKQHSPNKSHR